jgi:alpha-ketoglutaric semialdehyde dehydrogenase
MPDTGTAAGVSQMFAIDLPVEVRNRIGSEQRGASDGGTIERYNPAQVDRLVSVAPESTATDVADAVAAASEAAPRWAAMPPSQRGACLEEAAVQLARRSDQLAAELTAEEGKPIADARLEAGRAPKNLSLYAAEAIRLTGTTFPADDAGAVIYTRRDPVGVVGVITPWNFPLNLAARKIGPALAAGNTVVFKPSPFTPLMGERLAAAFADAGLPPGVLNVVHGHEAGRHLVADPRVDGVTFTGSTATGEKIHAALGLARRAQLELGGNNPIIVLDDADLGRAADVVATSAFGLSGQACTAAGRILAHEAVHQELAERVIALAQRHEVGPGDRPGVTLGPLIDESAVRAVAGAVRDSVDAGASVACGGDPLDEAAVAGATGWFYPPTLLTEVTSGMRVAAEEVFGPAVGVEVVGDLDEAIARANATPYGLTAAICTSNLAAAQRFASEIRAGMVRVNRPTVGTAFNAPFGGIKQSGNGIFKEQLGPGVMDFYTVSRTVFLGS